MQELLPKYLSYQDDWGCCNEHFCQGLIFFYFLNQFTIQSLVKISHEWNGVEQLYFVICNFQLQEISHEWDGRSREESSVEAGPLSVQVTTLCL